MSHPRERQLMRASLGAQVIPTVSGLLRAPIAADIAPLGRLLFAAYLGTIDQDEGTEKEAAAEVEKTFAGAYGEFLREASRVIELDGVLASAALITRWQDRPFVAFSLTLPSQQGRGLARAALISAMEHLRTSGETELRLVVTLANVPACALYRRLGFVRAGDAPVSSST